MSIDLDPRVSNALHLGFEMLGFFVGYRYYLYLKKNYPDKIPTENRIWILIGAAGGAFIFSRLVGALENPSILFESPFAALNNRTIVGGLLGGLLGVEVVKKLVKEQHSSGDLFTYPIMLAMIIGRLGCFFAGLHDNTVGIATALPWGVDFGDGIARHPTSLYEIAFLTLLWIILSILSQKVDFADGSLFKVFLISYLLFRFAVDSIKPYPIVLWSFNSIQLTCILGLIYYFRYIISPRLLLKSTNA